MILMPKDKFDWDQLVTVLMGVCLVLFVIFAIISVYNN